MSGESGRGRFNKDLSTFRDGEASRFAARECLAVGLLVIDGERWEAGRGGGKHTLGFLLDVWSLSHLAPSCCCGVAKCCHIQAMLCTGSNIIFWSHVLDRVPDPWRRKEARSAPSLTSCWIPATTAGSTRGHEVGGGKESQPADGQVAFRTRKVCEAVGTSELCIEDSYLLQNIRVSVSLEANDFGGGSTLAIPPSPGRPSMAGNA